MPSSLAMLASLVLGLSQVQAAVAAGSARRFIDGTVQAELPYAIDEATGEPVDPVQQLGLCKDCAREQQGLLLRARAEKGLFAAVKPSVEGLRAELVTVTSLSLPAVAPETDTLGEMAIRFSMRASEATEAALADEAVLAEIDAQLVPRLASATGLAFATATLGPLSARDDEREETVLARITERLWKWINTPLGWAVIGVVFGVIFLSCVACICCCDRRREAGIVRGMKV